MALISASGPQNCSKSGFDAMTELMDAFSNGLKHEKSECFKQFDVVTDETDHYFASKTKNVEKTSNAWTRKIQQEWKILEKDLPDTIYVRVYETRMDLLRAAIVGPAGTPYHDGLFFFDFQFTSKYPYEPPKANYRSGGLRLNPNLYNNGKVCLSLLNTWPGKGCENWDHAKSSMLQVLVSIQGLVLNAKPFYNEPVYSNSTSGYKSASLAYNDNAFILSCKTMMYTIRSPPKNFEQLVIEHFYKHAKSFIAACTSYYNGTSQIGSYTSIESSQISTNKKQSSKNLRKKLSKLHEELQRELNAKGIDLDTLISRIMSDSEAGDSNNSEYFSAQSDQISHCDVDESFSTKENVEIANGEKGKKGRIGNKLKQACKYLLKLGKKVLPTEN